MPSSAERGEHVACDSRARRRARSPGRRRLRTRHRPMCSRNRRRPGVDPADGERGWIVSRVVSMRRILSRRARWGWLRPCAREAGGYALGAVGIPPRQRVVDRSELVGGEPQPQEMPSACRIVVVLVRLAGVEDDELLSNWMSPGWKSISMWNAGSLAIDSTSSIAATCASVRRGTSGAVARHGCTNRCRRIAAAADVGEPATRSTDPRLVAAPRCGPSTSVVEHVQ